MGFIYEFGDKISMTTYRNAAADVTRWLRDEATGLVTNKVYADGKGPRYDYTPDGKLATRTWARGIVTTYSYDANGALTNTVYSDGTPTISIVYNRAGRQIEAHDAAGITTFLYDDFGSLTNETVIGVAGTNTIERFYDNFGLSLGYALNGVRQSTLAYDPATGSLVSISDAVANTEYSYSSDLLDTGYTLTLSNGEVLSRSVIRDERCRLLVTGIVSLENGNSIDSFTYAYDVLSRPTQRNCDTFCYNDRSEVTSATIAAEEPYFTSIFYGYDDIGNLTMSTSNSGSSSFTANGLNQYTSICSDFASLCEPTYDIDGNMLSNGDITFAYDSKSRLVAAAGQNGEYIVSNRYDHLDRRVQKVTPAATHTFFYDGWMLIKEIVASTNGTTDVVEYHWGKDLSGTIGGAGGVGGLLYLKRNGAIYVPWYDAYGNVMGYWDAQGNVVAEYTYDAFGNLISSSGPMADVFAIRYSTKYFDVETGFYYYGYRFYSPELMRWITRDPIGEEGGVNLYAFCENGSTFLIDATGLTKYWDKYMNFNDYTSGDVWKQVGGNLYWGYLSGTYHNSCALRVSRTLILNGHSPKKGEHRNVNKDYVTLKEIVSPDGVVIPKGTKLKAESNGKRYVISAHAIGSLLDECLTDPTVKKLKWRSEEEAKKLRACIEKEDGEAFFAANGHAGMIKKGYTDTNFPYKPTGRIWRIK